MYLNENIKMLKETFTGIDWNPILEYGNNRKSEAVIAMQSYSGQPTLMIKQNGSYRYIHSSYDPMHEAEIIASNSKEIKEGTHVLFYGVGFGYLIKAFASRYPNFKFSIYEPNPEVFYNFIYLNSLKDFPLGSLQSIFIESYFENEMAVKYDFFRKLGNSLAVIALPSYEDMFAEQFSFLSKELAAVIRDKRINLNTLYTLESLWLVNYCMNFGHVLRTANILNLDENVFKSKPAIIVSAGPSLQEELERLRYIKQNKLAYIFSVGSAIHELLKNGIYPDAVCAIDGDSENSLLYQELIEHGQDEVSLIFGSPLYFEVVRDYGANKFHMIIDRDPLAKYYIKNSDGSDCGLVTSAPSIALTALHLLHKLKCSPIILVGQNFAFKNNLYYSNGIDLYEARRAEMNEKDKAEAFLVEDVHGNMVHTKETLDTMRRQMSYLINGLQIKNVINTTKGGAKIEGTVFEPLESVIENRLKSQVVISDWNKTQKKIYDNDYLKKQQDIMLKEKKELFRLIDELIESVDKLKRVNKYRNEKDVNSSFNSLAKKFTKLIRNKFYEVYISPINTIQNEIFCKDIENLTLERDIVKRAKESADKFEEFIKRCKNDIELVTPLFNEVNNNIKKYLQI